MSRRCAEHFLFTGWLTGAFDLLEPMKRRVQNNKISTCSPVKLMLNEALASVDFLGLGR